MTDDIKKQIRHSDKNIIHLESDEEEDGNDLKRTTLAKLTTMLIDTDKLARKKSMGGHCQGHDDKDIGDSDSFKMDEEEAATVIQKWIRGIQARNRRQQDDILIFRTQQSLDISYVMQENPKDRVSESY